MGRCTCTLDEFTPLLRGKRYTKGGRAEIIGIYILLTKLNTRNKLILKTFFSSYRLFRAITLPQHLLFAFHSEIIFSSNKFFFPFSRNQLNFEKMNKQGRGEGGKKNLGSAKISKRSFAKYYARELRNI